MDRWEDLPGCQYAVCVSSASGAAECGEPASRRKTWDGGRTWLYLCVEHGIKLEKIEDLAHDAQHHPRD